MVCPECGRIRKYRPVTAAKPRTTVWRLCIETKKQAAWVTFKCPHCGRERSMNPSEAAKRTGEPCFHCARYDPREMPETFAHPRATAKLQKTAERGAARVV